MFNLDFLCDLVAHVIGYAVAIAFCTLVVKIVWVLL